MPRAGEADHDPVAWAGAEPGADVQADPMAITDDGADDVGEPRHEQVGGRQVVADEVDDEADLTAFRIVPTPGRWRSGIHSSSSSSR